jgi:hypothetical protein
MGKHRFTRCYRCDKVAKLFRCKYCNKYFCEEHFKPLEKGIPKRNDAKVTIDGDIEKYGDYKLNAHRCLEYENFKKRKEDEVNRRAFPSFSHNPWVPITPQNVIHEIPNDEQEPQEIKVPRKVVSLKPIIALVVIIIIGYMIYQNIEIVSNSIFSIITSFRPCQTSYVKAYESGASFGRDPSAYCKNTCLEKYNSSNYTLIEPNKTNKLTICYCYVENCSSSTSLDFTEAVKPTPTCGDKTPYNQCSLNRPFYCLNGTLTYNSSYCGCPLNEVSQGNSCISIFEKSPKIQEFKYVLRGSDPSINFTVYGGLNDYLAGLSRYYTCNPACPSENDLWLKFIDENSQSKYLNDLVDEIRSRTTNKDDQARIAISLVQNIPYDFRGLYDSTLNNRYPYEVIYDNKGVCGEKSWLLAYMLRNLGYGVALLSYKVENHMALGIKCPLNYSYLNTGYCFVETTVPSIVTDYEGDYMNVTKLSSNPDVIVISDGASFDSVSEEYNDAQKFIKINEMSISSGGVLDDYNYYTWRNLVSKYGIKIRYN